MTAHDHETPAGPQALTTTTASSINMTLASEMQRAAGVHALGLMDEADFNAQLSTLKRGLARLDALIKDVMVPDVDYKTVPGIREKVLTLPGAEKLCLMAKLVPSYEVERHAGVGADNSPAVLYVVACHLHLGSTEGPVIASAVGSANSNEPKYRYRSGERTCPACGKAGTIRKSKWEAKGGEHKGLKPWYCNAKAGGCGVEFAPGDARVEKQETGRVVNPDPLELDNTLLKMASKRALVSATKAATGGSARFTVDVDENPRAAVRTADATLLKDDEQELDAQMRADALEYVNAHAKEHGCNTRGDLYALIAKSFALDYKKPPTSMQQVKTQHLVGLAYAWQEAASGAPAASESSASDADAPIEGPEADDEEALDA